jgi:circadian clock protein KaiC
MLLTLIGNIMEVLKKSETGIKGFDIITRGGLPKGRPSLVCGSAGAGKTLFGIEFIVNGIRRFNEAGVIVSFEERTQDLIDNVGSLGWDLQKYIDEKKLAIDYIYIERSEIEETGHFNLDGLFIRISEAVRVTGAKRILIDTLESLFSGFTNEQLLRAEIRRLFKWLKDKELTAVITAEAGENGLTRYGLEEYLSDFVMKLDSRIIENISTRRLRIIKFRGTQHGVDEYPFLITDSGFSILPITEISLDYKAPSERFLTGIEQLDEMLGGKGLYRGSALLISGTPGSGKSSLAVSILHEACKRGEKVLYVSFEESRQQVLRNMASIGIDLAQWIDNGLLRFENYRSATMGIESHLINMIDILEREKPSLMVIDPLSSLSNSSTSLESKNLAMRVLHYIQTVGITCLFAEITHMENIEKSSMEISSLMDSWILLRHTEEDGVRRKTLAIVKARGIKHSDEVKELIMSENGIELRDLKTNVTHN